jgi:hypothetical protein
MKDTWNKYESIHLRENEVTITSEEMGQLFILEPRRIGGANLLS